jgi:hypothetical protein
MGKRPARPSAKYSNGVTRFFADPARKKSATGLSPFRPERERACQHRVPVSICGIVAPSVSAGTIVGPALLPPEPFVRTFPHKEKWNRRVPALVCSQQEAARKQTIFARIGFSHLRWDLRVAVGRRSHVFPQGFPPASRSWKRIFHINAEHVRSRGIHGVHEIPNRKCFRRRPNVLSGGNGMDNRKASRGGNRHFRFGCAAACIGGRNHHRGLSACGRSLGRLKAAPLGAANS